MSQQTGMHHSLTAEDIRYRRHVLGVEVKARILANQPQIDIANRMELPLPVVKEYESRYFDIRESLPHPELVWGLIIDGKPHEVLHPDHVIRFWHGVGYEHGISTLEPFLAPSHHSNLTKQGLFAYLRRDAELSLDSKLFVARQCCARMRTEQGMNLAHEIAAQSNWQHILCVSKTRNSVFGRVVSLLRKEIEDNGRQERRLQKQKVPVRSTASDGRHAGPPSHLDYEYSSFARDARFTVGPEGKLKLCLSRERR